MARVVTFEMDGVRVQLASMTWAQAEKFVEEGQDLIKRGDAVPGKEWISRTLSTVASSLGTDPEKIKEEYDMPTINAMFLKILEISGLKTGEEAATRTSASSAPPSLSVPAGPSTTATAPTLVA